VDKDPLRNDSEAAMKALFDTTSSERLPVLPGMSLYEMLGAAQANAKELKREREDRRGEFHRLLAPQDTPANGPAEVFGTVADQTRNLMNPVAPLPFNRALPPGTPNEPILPPSPPNNLSRPKLPFDEVAARYQGPALSPSAPPENKARQIEALKLMSRPSVLTMPGRQF
jgi:hypothetical protein